MEREMMIVSCRTHHAFQQALRTRHLLRSKHRLRTASLLVERICGGFHEPYRLQRSPSSVTSSRVDHASNRSTMWFLSKIYCKWAGSCCY